MTGTTRTTGGRVAARASERPKCQRGHIKEQQACGLWVCRVCRRRTERKRRMERRRQRLKARRARIVNRQRPPLRDRIWAAGLFEGEGTITLTRQSGKKVSRPRVAVSSTDASVTDYFQARWPGTVHLYRPSLKGLPHRDALSWMLDVNERIEGFLLDMMPHWRTRRVREKAELLLEDIRDRVHLRCTDAERARKARRMARMRVLNRRGLPVKDRGVKAGRG